jgi:hypothetical protein
MKKKVDRRKTWRKEAKKAADRCPCLTCIIKGNCSNLLKVRSTGTWSFPPEDVCPPVWDYLNQYIAFKKSMPIIRELAKKGLWNGKKEI